MTNEIIEMARQAGFDIDGLSEGQAVEFYEEWLNKMEAFAKLVIADARDAFAEQEIDNIWQAIKIESEACDFLCDEVDKESQSQWPKRLATMIRARSKAGHKIR
jgi:hypothetical protein